MPIVSERRVFQYVQEGGTCPFLDWLLRLKDAKARARIRARIARLRAGSLGDWKAVGGGVFELRIDHGPGYRVYFGQEGESIVILVSGGDKSSQDKDIKNARALWAEYRRRRDEPTSRLPG
ncbi:MAG: type II toxin-antitoxin system RelE/ParE family toxin [Thermodesulfobacteriota bacterium]